MTDDPLNRIKVKRGSQLPHAKLSEADVVLIRSIVQEREEMKAKLHEMTNAKLAEKFDVHQRTIDRVSSGENWSHV